MNTNEINRDANQIILLLKKEFSFENSAYQLQKINEVRVLVVNGSDKDYELNFQYSYTSELRLMLYIQLKEYGDEFMRVIEKPEIDSELHLKFILNWIPRISYDFNTWRKPYDIISDFKDSNIKLYPTNNPKLSETEFDIFLIGYLYTRQNNFWVHSFRYVEDHSNFDVNDPFPVSYSFAFLLEMGYIHEDKATSVDKRFITKPAHWIFFINTQYTTAEVKDRINNIIRKIGGIEIKIREHDLDYEVLKHFLGQDKSGETQNNFLNEIAEIDKGIFGKEFETEYKNCKDKFFKEDFASAMRDLRALVQTALTKICFKHSLEIGEKPDITNLSGRLRSKEVIKYEIHNQLLAFTSIANYSSHGVFPTFYDLEDKIVSNKFFLSFYLGCYLLKELENLLSEDDKD